MKVGDRVRIKKYIFNKQMAVGLKGVITRHDTVEMDDGRRCRFLGSIYFDTQWDELVDHFEPVPRFEVKIYD